MKDKKFCSICKTKKRVKRGTIVNFCLQCYKEKTHEYYVKNKAKRLAATKKWMKKNPEKVKGYKIISRDRLKRETFDHYGGAICNCCGEKEFYFLTLDHVRNNGAAEKRQAFGESGVKHGGGRFFHWLKRQGFPRKKDYQVLCWNCNRAKFDYKVCPHKRNTK